MTVNIDQHKRSLTLGQYVTVIFKSLNKRRGAIALAPKLCDYLHALLFGDTKLIFLSFIVKRKLAVILALAVFKFVITRRKLNIVITRKCARYAHELIVVIGHVDGLAFLHVDTRPDDMTMLSKHAALILLDMKDNCPALPVQSQRLFGALYVIRIKRARHWTLRRVRIDRQAIEIILAFGHGLGLRFELGKGAVEITGHSAANVGHFDILVVVRIEKMSGQIRTATALRSKRNEAHGFRPNNKNSAERISIRMSLMSSSRTLISGSRAATALKGLSRSTIA